MAARWESHVRFSCGVFAMVILVAVLRVSPVAAQISEMERGDDTSHRSSNNLVKLPWRKAKVQMVSFLYVIIEAMTVAVANRPLGQPFRCPVGFLNPHIWSIPDSHYREPVLGLRCVLHAPMHFPSATKEKWSKILSRFVLF